MRINTNVGALTAANNLTKVTDAVRASAEKLSSGFRINKASDDAAGLGVANLMNADIRALTQAQRNAEQAGSVYSIAEGGASAIEKMLERMKELATQSNSDTVDSDARAGIDVEYQALVSEITRTVNTTEFQATALLGGNTFDFQVGAARNVADYAGTDNVLSVSATDFDLSGLTATGDVTTAANAQTELSAIDADLTTVNTVLANIGAGQNRLSNAVDTIKSTILNYQAAESTVRDLDMASEMVNFSKNQIIAQAGTAMLAQANQSGQGILKLLQ